MSQDDVSRILKENPRGMTAMEVAERLAITPTTARSNINALMKCGEVVPHGMRMVGSYSAQVFVLKDVE